MEALVIRGYRTDKVVVKDPGLKSSGSFFVETIPFVRKGENADEKKLPQSSTVAENIRSVLKASLR